MAGDWIKVEHALPDKPEVFRMAEVLSIDPDAVVGKLVRFWSWCDQQTISGNALGVTDSFIDRLTHQPGFSDALRKVDWLLARSGSLAVPHFDRHNGHTAKARAVTNRRVANHRNNGGGNAECVTDVTGAALQKPLPEKRREDIQITPLPAREESGGDVRFSDHERGGKKEQGSEAASSVDRFPGVSNTMPGEGAERTEGTEGGSMGRPGGPSLPGEAAPAWMGAELARLWGTWLGHVRELGVPVTQGTRAAWALKLQRACRPNGAGGTDERSAIAMIEFSLEKTAKSLIEGEIVREGRAPREKPAAQRKATSAQRGAVARPITPSALFPEGPPRGVTQGEW